MSFYEFTRQFPDDEACLKRIMIERYGGTELDCPKCGEYGKFYRMDEGARVRLPALRPPSASDCRDAYGADSLAAA